MPRTTQIKTRGSSRRCAHYDCDALWIQNFQDGGEGRDMRSFAQEKKSQQAPEIDALVRDRKVFAWCHKIN